MPATECPLGVHVQQYVIIPRSTHESKSRFISSQSLESGGGSPILREALLLHHHIAQDKRFDVLFTLD